MTTSNILRLVIVTAVGLFALWLFTGGVAIQSTQRFDSVGESPWNEHEGVKVSLEGSVSYLDIPFLVSRYTEKGPFRLRVAYYNHAEKHFHELHLHSVKVMWADNQPIQLVQGNAPAILRIETSRYVNSISQGVVWNTVHSAVHTFDQPLDIPFGTERIVRCEIQAELVGDGVSRRVNLTPNLKGHTIDFVKTYWAHLADS